MPAYELRDVSIRCVSAQIEEEVKISKSLWFASKCVIAHGWDGEKNARGGILLQPPRMWCGVV